MNKEFWQNKRVLITGGDGFIGSSFLSALKSSGVQVFNASLSGEKPVDILNQEEIISFCCNNKVDLIIHCAAVDGNAKFKSENADKIFNDNLKLAENILAAARAAKVLDIVLISSAEVYSALNAMDADIKPSNYALVKLSIEKLFQTWASNSAHRLMIVRSSNVYGSAENRPSDLERVIPAMIRKAKADLAIEIWGSGKEKRNFLHIDDLVNGVLLAAQKDYFKTFCLSGPRPITIIDLARLIIDLTKSKSEINFKEQFSVIDYLDFKCDNSLNLENFFPRSIELGLKEVLKEKD